MPNYYSYGYEPYQNPYQNQYSNPPMVQQMQMQSVPPMYSQNIRPSMAQPQNSTNANWVYVPDINAVREFKPENGQTVYIMNQNKPEFYVKSADAMGMCTTKVCPFEAYDLADYDKKLQSGTSIDAQKNLVTQEEFNAVIGNVTSQMNHIQQEVAAQMNQMRQSIMYPNNFSQPVQPQYGVQQQLEEVATVESAPQKKQSKTNEKK